MYSNVKIAAIGHLSKSAVINCIWFISSVVTEEMLHLTLAANVLTSVGGHPRLTDALWVPHYPTSFPSKELIQV